jgi:hypothetical protein
VSVLQNSQEIPLVEALTIATQELARGGANLARPRRFVVYRAAHEVESFLASEA